jgi:hypothetical protein
MDARPEHQRGYQNRDKVRILEQAVIGFIPAALQ